MATTPELTRTPEQDVATIRKQEMQKIAHLSVARAGEQYLAPFRSLSRKDAKTKSDKIDDPHAKALLNFARLYHSSVQPDSAPIADNSGTEIDIHGETLHTNFELGSMSFAFRNVDTTNPNPHMKLEHVNTVDPTQLGQAEYLVTEVAIVPHDRNKCICTIINSAGATERTEIPTSYILDRLAGTQVVKEAIAQSSGEYQLSEAEARVMNAYLSHLTDEAPPDDITKKDIEAAGVKNGQVTASQVETLFSSFIPPEDQSSRERIKAVIDSTFGEHSIADISILSAIIKGYGGSDLSKTPQELTIEKNQHAEQIRQLDQKISEHEQQGKTDTDEYRALVDQKNSLQAKIMYLDHIGILQESDQAVETFAQAIKLGRLPPTATSMLLEAVGQKDISKISELLLSLSASEDLTDDQKKKLKNLLEKLGPQLLAIGGPILVIIIIGMITKGFNEGMK